MLGGRIFFNHERHPIAAAALETYAAAPAWGSTMETIRSPERRPLGAGVYPVQLAPVREYLPGSRSKAAKDPLGDPVCRITAGPKENEQRASNYAADKAAEWLELRVPSTWSGPPPAALRKFQPTRSADLYGGQPRD